MRKLLALTMVMAMLFVTMGLSVPYISAEEKFAPIREATGVIGVDGRSWRLIRGTSSIIMEGSTSDGNETTLSFTNPTADRTVTFPDSSGTVAYTGDIGTSMSLTDAKVLVGASTGLAAEKTLSLTGDVTGTFLNSGAAATTIVANAVDSTEVNDNAVGLAQFNVSTINVPIANAATSGTATVTAGSFILGGAYAFANVNGEVANITAISSTTLTVTLTAAAAVPGDLSAIFRVSILEP